MVPRPLLLKFIAIIVTFLVALEVSSATSDTPVLLSGRDSAAVRGAQGGDPPPCTHRYYTYTCSSLEPDNDPDACLSKAAANCSGSCLVCGGILFTQPFCDTEGAKNVRNCTVTTSESITCGFVYSNVCHLHNGDCQCYGPQGTKTGDNCAAHNIVDYTTPCQ